MTEDLKKIDVPNAELKIHEGGSHSMCTTEKDKVNRDLLEFIKS
jgi:non-heme chloroperoxidase